MCPYGYPNGERKRRMKTVDENCKQRAARQTLTHPSNEPIWDAFFRYVLTETSEDKAPSRKQKELATASA